MKIKSCVTNSLFAADNYKYSFFLIIIISIITITSSTSTLQEDVPLVRLTVNISINNDTDSFENLIPFEDVDPTNPIFIFMCIVYTLSTLTAIFSNLVVLLVYKFGFSATTDLTLYLVNLAVADFLMSTVCMPFTFAQALLKKWIFGNIMCPIVLFKQVLAVSLSIYTLVAIGIDRYV